MLRLIVRFAGFLCLAIAFAAAIVDGTRSIAAGASAILPLGRTLSGLFPDAFLAAHTAIATHVPLLWDPVLVAVLLLPAWVVIGLMGMVLVALTRRPRPKIGYSRR
jgi:hypothetical protein